MAANDIHVRLCLQEIVKLDLEVKAIIQDVRECTDLEDLDDFNAKAREKLNHLRSKIEDLERIGKEQDRAEDRQVILKNVENHKQRMTSNIASLRKTNLSVKLAIDKKEKEELLAGGSVKKRSINNKETLAKQATSITESLMELNQTMDAQVKKGNLTLTTLGYRIDQLLFQKMSKIQTSHNVQGLTITIFTQWSTGPVDFESYRSFNNITESSSRTISDTHEEFKNMGGQIHTSKKLLTKYGRRELTDKLLIFIALVFFFSTVLYILKRRLWS